MDKLNSEVTVAILEAEHLVFKTIAAYRRVLKAEQALAEHAATPVEREIAQSGVRNATSIIERLSAIVGQTRATTG